MTHDNEEPSAASAGSVRPFAWAVCNPVGTYYRSFGYHREALECCLQKTRETGDCFYVRALRLAALEELSALDQELELQYGLTGNPMIKGQEHTPQMQTTPGDGSKPRGCTEPVAWLVEGCEYDTGCEFQYVALLKEQADAAAAEGATVTPLNISQQSRLWIAAAEYTGGISAAGESKPTLTPEEREAVEIAVEYVGSAYQVEHYAAVLRRLLERLK